VRFWYYTIIVILLLLTTAPAAGYSHTGHSYSVTSRMKLQDAYSNSRYLSDNITVPYNHTLDFMDCNITVTVQSHVYITVYGVLLIKDSSLNSMLNGSQIIINVRGTQDYKAQLCLINSYVDAGGTISSTDANIFILNSSIDASLNVTDISEAFRVAAANSSLVVSNSTINGLYSTSEAVNSSIGEATYSDQDPVSRDTLIPLSNHLTGQGSAIVSSLSVSMNYSGNNPYNRNNLSFCVGNTTILRYAMNSTGSISNISHYILIIPVVNYSLNLSQFSQRLKLKMNVSYEPGSNSTLWNISVNYITNETVISLGSTYFNYILKNSIALMYESCIGLKDLPMFDSYHMLNPERNSICLVHSSLYFIDNNISLKGSCSPVETSDNSSFATYVTLDPEVLDFGHIVSNYSFCARPDNGNGEYNNLSMIMIKDLEFFIKNNSQSLKSLFSKMITNGRIIPQYLQEPNEKAELSNYLFTVDGMQFNRSIPLFPYFSENQITEIFRIFLPMVKLDIIHPPFYNMKNDTFSFSFSNTYGPIRNATWIASVIMGNLKEDYAGNFSSPANNTIIRSMEFYPEEPGVAKISIGISFRSYTEDGLQLFQNSSAVVYRSVFVSYLLQYHRVNYSKTEIDMRIRDSGVEGLQDAFLLFRVNYSNKTVCMNRSLKISPFGSVDEKFLIPTVTQMNINATLIYNCQYIPENSSRYLSSSIPGLSLYNVTFIFHVTTAKPVFVSLCNVTYTIRDRKLSVLLPNGSYTAVITSDNYVKRTIGFNISGSNVSLSVSLFMRPTFMNYVRDAIYNYAIPLSPFIALFTLYIYNRYRNSVRVCIRCSSTYKGRKCPYCRSGVMDDSGKKQGPAG